ncbi:unnamed protein product [Trifolium pratense]|nr:unnamed protein product [Trifolium pratense]
MKFVNYKVIKSYSIFHTQIRENMAEAIKFVYVMIIFFSLFLVAMNVDGAAFIMCTQDSDCPKDMCSSLSMNPKCHMFEEDDYFPDPLCICARVMPLFPSP